MTLENAQFMAKNKRFRQVLINPTEEEILEREPLMAFSFYLSGRNNVLLSLSDEIIDNLDSNFSSKPVKSGTIEQSETQIWLWVLGAYEVIRTISQAKECFTEEFNNKITKLKKELVIARMPSAKMEKTGKKVPVNSNRSPAGWNIENKDLLIGDPEKPISARKLLENYDETLTSLTPAYILKRH